MIAREVQTTSRTEFVDVTSLVAQAVTEAGLDAGVVVVFNPHTTAGLTINEGADPDVVRDLTGSLEKQVPWQDGYRHAEGNAAAHIKATLCGSSVTVIVRGGRLELGTWQTIWFAEFDGPRQRRLLIQPLAAG